MSPFPERLFSFSFLHSPPLPCYVFDSFIYRGQESLMGRWIPSDIMWWISIRRINSGFVCRINPHHTLIHRHQPGQYIIHRNFIMLFVCFEKKEAKKRIQKSGAYSTRNCCSVVFFYKHNLQLYLFFSWKNGTSTQIWLNLFFFSFAQWFIKCFHTYYIISLGTAPTAFSLPLSGFIRKMWLLFSICALISSIQGNENALVG